MNINESIELGNEANIAANLGILANIYHSTGDDIRALGLATRALTLLERFVSSDSSSLAPLINNIGTIQISMNLFSDALLSFIRVLHICERTLPKGHPKRVVIENNVRQLSAMQQYNGLYSYSSLWRLLPKILCL